MTHDKNKTIYEVWPSDNAGRLLANMPYYVRAKSASGAAKAVKSFWRIRRPMAFISRFHYSEKQRQELEAEGR